MNAREGGREEGRGRGREGERGGERGREEGLYNFKIITCTISTSSMRFDTTSYFRQSKICNLQIF